MNPTKTKRLESVKIIISESIMVIAVILTVVVLAFIVSGYWVNSDFKVERQGMLQISSIPTGAYISVDNDNDDPSWLSVTTNTSKVLSSGEHTVSLIKDGYDSWSKTINISEGLLYRLHYPRLFLKERASESVMDIETATSATVSPNREKAVVFNNTSEWQLLELNNETPKRTSLNVVKLFSGISVAENAEKGLFTGEIISTDWDSDNNHLLMKVKNPDSVEWVLLDLKNLDRSINLTKEFGASFEDVKMLDSSSSSLLALQNRNLHRINLSNKSISSILVKNVIDFDHFENEIVFSAESEDDIPDKERYYIGTLKIGDGEPIRLKSSPVPTNVAISKFYDDRYITTLYDNRVTTYKKDKNELAMVLEQELGFNPERMKVGHNGEFIIFSKDNTLATLDLESNSIREWVTDGPHFGWLDNDMIYSVSDSNLIVYDYDGLNRRELSDDVSGHFPVTITDDKWLYYISDGELVREWLIEH